MLRALLPKPTQHVTSSIRRVAGRCFRPAALPAILLLLLTIPRPVAAQAQPADTTAPRVPKRVDLAVQQTLLSNFVVNRFNAWVLREPWAREVDFESWSHNLRMGWEWDEDQFVTNMFGHPYQGASYFNAGRANGLTYWESVPLAFFGSWTWEFFGETNRPSLNDFFTTGFGGVAVGEMSHRVAATIRDEQARGAERIAREMAAFVVNPLGGLDRLFRGHWTRIGPNPPEHDPASVWFGAAAGVRSAYERSASGGSTEPAVLFDVHYGDSFGERYREPFDVFRMHAQFSTDGLNTLQTTGRLYQAGLPSWGMRVRHAFAVHHRFDYLNNPVYRFGGQSIDVGVLSRIPLAGGLSLNTRLAGGFLVLGAISAPENAPDRGDRPYDFGPGLGAVLSADLVRGRTTYLSLYNRAEYLHSVSGTPATHVIGFTGLRGMLPIYRNVGVGFYLSGDARVSRYTDLPDISRQFAETRLFVTWTSSRQSEAPRMR